MIRKIVVNAWADVGGEKIRCRIVKCCVLQNYTRPDGHAGNPSVCKKKVDIEQLDV